MAGEIGIVMPAYNAGRLIPSVLLRIPAEVWEKIGAFWIVNDGSLDDTAAVIQECSETFHVVRMANFTSNRGYGAAVREGLKRCRNHGCSAVVCLHADGQYAPESILQLIEKMTSGSFDIVQGSRIASKTALRGGMPLYKYISNRVLTFFENVVYGLKLTDYHSGYLVYSSKALELLPFDRFSNTFEFDVEVIAAAKSYGLRIGEVPIPTRYAGEKSHVPSIQYGFKVLGVMRKYLKGAYKP
jgi:glycosyltransferase involved in cell wall biosynthesis